MIRLLSTANYVNLPWWDEFVNAYLNVPDEIFGALESKLFGNDSRFAGAVWELFLWSKFHAIGAKVLYERKMPNSEKLCDFEVTFGAATPVLIEATSKSHSTKLIHIRRVEEDLSRALRDSIHCRYHYITARVSNAMETTPDIPRLVSSINTWIWKHESRQGKEIASFEFVDASGWEFECEATPILGASSGFLGFGGATLLEDDVSPIRIAIERKLSKFDVDHGLPSIIAVVLDSEAWKPGFFDRFSALYARPAISINPETNEAHSSFTDYWDGLSNETYANRVSAVLFGAGEFPGFSSHLPLDLWMNGTATAPLTPEMFPIATLYHRVTESGLECFDRTGTAQWEPVHFP